MDDDRDAKAAIEELDGAQINGQKVKVELAKTLDNGFSDRSGQSHSGRGGGRPRGRPSGRGGGHARGRSGSVSKETSDQRYRSSRSIEDR